MAVDEAISAFHIKPLNGARNFFGCELEKKCKRLIIFNFFVGGIKIHYRKYCQDVYQMLVTQIRKLCVIGIEIVQPCVACVYSCINIEQERTEIANIYRLFLCTFSSFKCALIYEITKMVSKSELNYVMLMSIWAKKNFISHQLNNVHFFRVAPVLARCTQLRLANMAFTFASFCLSHFCVIDLCSRKIVAGNWVYYAFNCWNCSCCTWQFTSKCALADIWGNGKLTATHEKYTCLCVMCVVSGISGRTIRTHAQLSIFRINYIFIQCINIGYFARVRDTLSLSPIECDLWIDREALPAGEWVVCEQSRLVSEEEKNYWIHNWSMRWCHQQNFEAFSRLLI